MEAEIRGGATAALRPTEHRRRTVTSLPPRGLGVPAGAAVRKPLQPVNPELTEQFHQLLTRLRVSEVCRFKYLRVTRCYGDNGAFSSIGLIPAQTADAIAAPRLAR